MFSFLEFLEQLLISDKCRNWHNCGSMHWLSLAVLFACIILIFHERSIIWGRNFDLFLTFFTLRRRWRRGWWGRLFWHLLCLLSLFFLLLDYSLIFSVSPFDNSLDDLVPLPLLAPNACRLIVDDSIQLLIMFSDYLELGVHRVCFHISRTVCLRESQWRIE